MLAARFFFVSRRSVPECAGMAELRTPAGELLPLFADALLWRSGRRRRLYPRRLVRPLPHPQLP